MPTDWAISSGDYMRPYLTRGSDAGSLNFGPESTAQSFLRGSLLEADSQVSTSAHRLRIALRSNSTVTSTSLLGVAAEGASSIVDQSIIYWPITPQTEFMARTRGSTLNSTNIGQPYGLCFDSTKNVYMVDLANTQSTSLRVVITGLIDGVGDSGGYVRFKFGRAIGSTVTFGPGANPITY